MKNYLLAFRDQVFNGSMMLYKRIFVPYLILSFIVGIITAVIFIPLLLKFLGWDFVDLQTLESRMSEIGQTGQESDPSEVFKSLFTTFNFEYLIPLVLLGFFITPWSLNIYYTLNDFEVRNNNINIIAVLKASFSGKIFTLLAFVIVYYLLIGFSFMIFIFLIIQIMSMVKILGILLGFFGIFFLILFLFRFALAPAAIVHGNMNMSQAFGYSFSNFTMKRSALLCLMGLVVLVVMGIISSISSSIVDAIISKNEVDAMLYFVVGQIFANIFGALAGAFIFAGSSALYFRYSTDEIEDNTTDHLIGND